VKLSSLKYNPVSTLREVVSNNERIPLPYFLSAVNSNIKYGKDKRIAYRAVSIQTSGVIRGIYKNKIKQGEFGWFKHLPIEL
jgi:hypothetical protein